MILNLTNTDNKVQKNLLVNYYFIKEPFNCDGANESIGIHKVDKNREYGGNSSRLFDGPLSKFVSNCNQRQYLQIYITS